MPHVIVKLVVGKSEAQKKMLAEKITESVMTALGSEEKAVSIAMQEIEKEDWAEIYNTDIIGHQDQLYKKPGYTV